jgi:hypothetical protein
VRVAQAGVGSAREFRRAAPVATECQSCVGEYPGEWDYAGCERISFVAERQAALSPGAVTCNGYDELLAPVGPMRI